MKQPMRIQDVMTPCPYTIHEDLPIARGKEIMRINGIRHLPVVRHGLLTGVLSERDIQFSESYLDTSRFPVSTIMVRSPEVVTPEVPLVEILDRMGDDKLSSILVQDRHGRVLGIFTTIDAVTLLGRVMSDSSIHDRITQTMCEREARIAG